MKKLNLLNLALVSFIVCLFSILVLALLPAEDLPCVKWLIPVALPLLVFGLLLEILQLLSGYRQFSLLDVFADGVGIAAGLLFCLLFAKKLKKYLAEPFLKSLERARRA